MQIKIMKKNGENKSTRNVLFEAPLSSSPKKKSTGDGTNTYRLLNLENAPLIASVRLR
jgi:hypothetical protein